MLDKSPDIADNTDSSSKAFHKSHHIYSLYYNIFVRTFILDNSLGPTVFEKHIQK